MEHYDLSVDPDKYQERRTDPRATWSDTATMRLGHHAVTCKGVDLGPGGASLTGSWVARAGQSVLLRFDLGPTTIHVMGRVVWAQREDRGSKWGVEFTDLQPEASEELVAFIERHDAA